ncbi:phosphatidylglycerol lysyltransferase domain-containing protein [Bacillus sp. Marseille-P3661]|uniref:phosphatidylglycerol lysyltransferase domain-containing protein n=1 Tax=Bacillus sp. Marseille-P3661 TaxID=1936234 RepID=UPI000C830F72|nr:phosphatidylglycerol lysyltransferase domain-containing protein [Bacillus sp. Marseille-P3661]
MRGRFRLARNVKLGDWQFFSLRLKDKEIYTKYVMKTQYNQNLFSSNFDLLWSSSGPMYGNVLWRIVDGMLVVFRLYQNRTLKIAFLPLGEGKIEHVTEVLYKCALFCHEWNGGDKSKSVVLGVNHSQLTCLNELNSFKQKFRCVQRMGVERHLSVQKLLELKGSEFEKVRYAINRFKRDYPNVRIRRGTINDFASLVKLKQDWNQTLGKKYPKIRDDSRYRRILKYQKKLNHIVLVAELDGQIIGMYTGGILPHGQAWAGLHKKREEFDGLSEYLYVEFAKEIHRINPSVETINLGTDIGVGSGLRNFKNKFRPVLNEERYSLYLM